MPSAEDDKTPVVSYEELADLEKDFDDAELEILRQQYARFEPLYAKREALISKIDHFWALVFEAAPLEIDQWLQPSDMQVLAESLKSVNLTRFEINDPAGSPRSFAIKFTFEPNNWFKETVLEKKFWYRRSLNDSVGPTLVSEPVQITWLEGHDLTKGVNNAAYKLFNERKNKSGDAEVAAVKELVETIQKAESDEAQSFFAWFSFVSHTRFITAEESAEANKKEAELREKHRKGEKVEAPEDAEEEELEIDVLSEIHPAGEDLAQLIAEDLWPNAVKYFTTGAEGDDEDLSDLEDAEEMEDTDDDEPVDIRALVGKGKKDSNSPPPKKRKT